MPKSQWFSPAKIRTERGLALLTVVRLALIPAVVATFMSLPLVTTLCLALFMVLDLGDGILARRAHADGVLRRSLDSTIDRVAIDACLIGAGATGAMPPTLVVLFLARDAYCAFLCIRMVSERRVAIKADIVHRLLNFSLAAWCFTAPFISSEARGLFAAMVLVLSVLVAVDLTRMTQAVRRGPISMRDRVVAASSARRGFREDIKYIGSSALKSVPQPS